LDRRGKASYAGSLLLGGDELLKITFFFSISALQSCTKRAISDARATVQKKKKKKMEYFLVDS
jgi:hypothetical protein